MARPRRQQRSTTAARKPPYELPDPELIVVVDAGAGIRATPEELTAAGTDAAALQRAAGQSATLVPLFGASEERLRFEASVAASRGQALPDLSVYYRVEGAGARSLE